MSSLELTPGTIGLIAYLSITFIFLAVLSVRAYRLSPWKNTSSFIKAVRSMRSIYGAILVHLYDTSTDVAILISWGILSVQELTGKQEVENVNMLTFFIPSIILIFVYRIAYAIVHYNAFKYIDPVLRRMAQRDIILILLDVYIFKLVYQQFGLLYLSPCLMQKKLQLFESVFESMPQLVLQSIFLIRTYGTGLADNDAFSVYIVFASIIASLLSIVNKFSSDDARWVDTRASSARCRFRCPCISLSFCAVLFWRFCESIARFSVFTLLWAIVGGLYLPIYLLLVLVVYFLLEVRTDLVWINWRRRKDIKAKFGTANREYVQTLILTAQAVVGIPLKKHFPMHLIRFVENTILLAVLYIFAFVKFDCSPLPCYDKEERNFFYGNPYIQTLLILSSVATLLSFITFIGLYVTDTVHENGQHATVELFGVSSHDHKRLQQAVAHPAIYSGWLNQHGRYLDASSMGSTANSVAVYNTNPSSAASAINPVSSRGSVSVVMTTESARTGVTMVKPGDTGKLPAISAVQMPADSEDV